MDSSTEIIEQGDYVKFEITDRGVEGWTKGAGYVASVIDGEVHINTDHGVITSREDDITLVCKQYRLDV